MSFHEINVLVISFIQQNEIWAIPIIFLLAFGESLAFISLLLPATFILLTIGAFIGQSEIAFLPLWLSAVIGAFLGDWLSYWFGLRYHKEVERMWPLSKYPDLLDKGYLFFNRWGSIGVFIGRFFGPLRAVVPLVAGVCRMSQIKFQLVNLLSAIIWGAGILAPGAFGIPWLAKLFS